MLSYLALFGSAFIAATLLPAQSEAVLYVLVTEGEPKWLLWVVATLGNTLGAWVNWGLGRYLLHFETRSWFPFRADRMARAQSWFARYGQWSLLMSWLPLVGDGLTFVAGVMKTRWWLFLLLCAIGKGARYAVVIGIAHWVH